MIRGLLQGLKPSKQLLLYSLQRFCPKVGDYWKPTFRWSFMEDNKLAISTKWEDRFPRPVLNSWKDVSLGLVKRSPKVEVEFYRKPLIWDSHFTDHKGHMLGRRT